MTVRAGIVGGSGYAGGETHPNLRGHTDLRYCTVDELERCDLLFLCVPHGSAAGDIDIYSELAPRIVDLSADFRLRPPSAYADWYGAPHPAPEWLDRFVYGLPELDREAAGRVHLSVTSVEMVRGVLATSHLFLTQPDIGKPTERELFRAYRSFCRQQPFVRLVKERRGIHRYPEPKILGGSNHAEVGFDLDPRTGRLVVICAIDNLMKGAAGNAVQCANLMCGFPDIEGLAFPGLHPL